MHDKRPYINGLIIAGILFCLLVLYFVSRRPAPLVPSLPPMLHGPDAERTFSGIVAGYEANPTGDIDQLVLMQEGRRMAFHFPPHAARQVLAVAVVNRKVQLQAYPGPPHHMAYELISIQGTGRQLEIRDLPPLPPAGGQEITIQGKITGIRTDEQGRVTAFILSNKLVALPPHMAAIPAGLVNTGQPVTVYGQERVQSEGFVNKTGLPVVKPSRINIAGANYVIQ